MQDGGTYGLELDVEDYDMVGDWVEKFVHSASLDF